jgi:hypothetical protein
MRIKEEGVSRKAFKGCVERRRSIGRASGRWIDAVDRAAKRLLKCKNRRRLAEDGDVWRRRIEESRAQIWL